MTKLVGLVSALIFFVAIADAATRYEIIKEQLVEINQNNKDLTQLFTIGKNDFGKDIIGIKINAGVAIRNTVNHLYVGSHHGNEEKTVDVALVFIDDVIKVYRNKNHEYHSKYQNITFHIIPVLNINGYNSSNRYEKNAQGTYIDPNRDYPDPCYEYEVFKLKSTYNLANYMQTADIVGAVTGHGYIGTFTFPWGTYATDTKTPDHKQFSKMAAAAVVHNGYRYGTHTDLIYAATGAFEDWAYHQFGTWIALLEMSRSANLNNDSKLLLTYYSMIPDERSANHEHGDCRDRERMLPISRP